MRQQMTASGETRLISPAGTILVPVRSWVRFPLHDARDQTPARCTMVEVLADDMVIFSKKAIGRHAEAGEVARLLEEKTGIKPQPRS